MSSIRNLPGPVQAWGRTIESFLTILERSFERMTTDRHGANRAIAGQSSSIGNQISELTMRRSTILPIADMWGNVTATREFVLTRNFTIPPSPDGKKRSAVLVFGMEGLNNSDQATNLLIAETYVEVSIGSASAATFMQVPRPTSAPRNWMENFNPQLTITTEDKPVSGTIVATIKATRITGSETAAVGLTNISVYVQYGGIIG